MSLDFEQLIQSARQVKLSPQAKQQLHNDVALYVADHPVKPRLFFWQLRWLEVKEIITLKPLAADFKYIALVIILLMMSVGSVSWAAEQSVPGDILYPIKINVNEVALSALTFSSQGKAAVSAWQAARRLSEVEQLAVAGKLDDAKMARLEARFEEHVARFEHKKDQLDDTTPELLKASTNSRFEGMLKGHAEVLDNLEIRNRGNGSAISPILEKVKGHITQVEKNRVQGEDNLSNNRQNLHAPAAGQLVAAQNKIREVQSYISNARISEANKTAAFGQLAQAQTVLDEAEASLNNGLYIEAITKSQASMRLSQQAKLLATAAEKLKINFSDNGSANNPDANGLNFKIESETGDVKGANDSAVGNSQDKSNNAPVINDAAQGRGPLRIEP